MGMYTGYRFRFRLRADTPAEIIGLLQDMMDVSKDPELRTDLPQHPFFLTYRWYVIFTMAGGGFYFEKEDGTTTESERRMTQDPETGSWLVEACAQTKGSTQDAALLLDWLKPWLMAAPWEVLAAARYCEETSYADSSCFGGFSPRSEDPDFIDGEYHHQYWLVEGQIVERKTRYCVTEIQLPLTLDPNTKFKPVEYWFDNEMAKKMREWPVSILPLSEPVTTAINKAVEWIQQRETNRDYVRKNLIATLVEAPAGTREIRTNHPDVQAFAAANGMVTISYPWRFNPNLRKVRVRRNLAAPIPVQQARGYYQHSHKGRGFRQGVPRPKMAPIVTLEEDPNKPVREALKPWLLVGATEKGPLPPNTNPQPGDYGPPKMIIDTENSFDAKKFLGL